MTPPYRAYPAPSPPHFGRTLPEYAVPEHSGVTVWLSHIKRVGQWVLPRTFRAFTFMGNAELDLTNAQMSAGTSEIEIRCIFGNVEISVPQDIRIQCDGDGFLGSFDVELVGDVADPPVDAPLLRVTGAAYMGSVTLKIIGTPGPTWKERLKSAKDFFYS